MKKTLLILAITFSALDLQAGNEPLHEKGYLAIRTGFSNPTGNFGSKNLENKEAGLAEQGFHLSAEYAGFLDNYFGLGASFGINRYGIDLSGVNRAMRTNNYAHTKYRSNLFLGHIIFKYPLAPVFAIYGKLSGGASFNTLPDITNGFSSPSNRQDYIKREALAYGGAGGIKWHAGAVGVGFEVSAINTKPTFTVAGSDVKQEMNALNYSLSLSYQIR